ncbi:SspB family protein [Caulobacter sp. S45]|uniref:SspB family protein n=1 Tax=Caulobacter sp. S45 TaxID=1641861 RepID=UPI0020C68921|nr:ClpXP protease specificity-enhancing factor SspB [Caulobacter sp. S45]
MTQDRNDQDQMGYEAMAQEALRGVVKAALKRAAGPGGLPAAHHFYVTFKTRAPGVSIPPELVEKYPDEMTIVVQHQFWDLAPGETFFSVTLRFGGQPKRLSMPYQAVTRFYDPSVQFLLQFEPPEAEAAPATAELLPLRRPEPVDPSAQDGVEPSPPEDPRPEGDGPKIVSLDKFRKK